MPNPKNRLHSGLLNIAALQVGTHTLGPGWRAGLWVQGCELTCPGCIAPEWQIHKPGFLTSPEALSKIILADPEITGLTLSGGEPFLQAGGLAAVARLVRQHRSLDVICYTGFTRRELEELADQRSVSALLGSIDVLIDGRYIAAMNDGVGLRGSANQVVHHLTDRLEGYDFDAAERFVEIVVREDDVLVVGLPPAGFSLDLDAPRVELEQPR